LTIQLRLGMMNVENNNRLFIKDMGWYIFGTLVPMTVGFIKTPIFTRYFTPEEFGYLGIITITFSYISVFLYSWLSGCLWRYYNAFKEKNDSGSLYSNLFAIFSAVSLVLFIISLIWYLIAGNLLVKELILLSFLQYLVKELIGLFLIVSRLEGRTLKYNIIQSLRAVLSFGLLYIMAFEYNYRISSMLTSMIAIDILVLIFLIAFNSEKVRITLKKISRSTLKILFRFGSIGLISNFCFLIISSSDRYIIAIFEDLSVVGIYNQVYNICQLSVVAMVTVFFNTINPKLNRELEINFSEADRLISKYIYVFLLFGLPIVTYLSLFSKQIAILLLGTEFRSGYIIMPYIFISAYLYGMFLFIEIKFKFADKLKNIAIGVIIASILNVGLNFIYIPLYGFLWAGITTLIAYLFLVVYFYWQDEWRFFSEHGNLKAFLLFSLILLVQIVADKIFRNYFDLNFWQTFAEGSLFLVLYFMILRKKIVHLKIPV
jgi:O-antigen/teichoic acid export membrane protein